jgi:thymidylate synthase (FAD)
VSDFHTVLGDGFVRLDKVMADDLSVVNAARVSFGKKHDTLQDGDAQLINFLMRERHGTPFEHNSFRFHVRAPIFVAREWFRHRSGWSYNEYSARYSRMEPEYYVPDVQDVRTQVGKPGSYTFDPMDSETAELVQQTIAEASGHAYRTYNYLLEIGVAKELARSVLPVGMYTEFYATCNARSLMHFISLRADETAQREIRCYGETLARFLDEHMPETYKAFLNNGQIAP